MCPFCLFVGLIGNFYPCFPSLSRIQLILPALTKSPAAAASLPMLYKIIILVPAPALVIGMLLYLYWFDPSPPQPAWAFSSIIMSVSAFAVYSLFLFAQWVYRKTRNTPIGELYGLPYAVRKKVIEGKISSSIGLKKAEEYMANVKKVERAAKKAEELRKIQKKEAEELRIMTAKKSLQRKIS